MDPFTTLTAVAAPMVRTNIDTDAIYPINVPDGIDPAYTRFGERMFGLFRYLPDGSLDPDFVLNEPKYRGAKILVGGVNFGCGSSRETAVWALYEYGFRAVLAPSFGDIFAQNAVQNGLLTAWLPEDVIVKLGQQLEASNSAELSVDLVEKVVIGPDGTRYPFEIPEARRQTLLAGLSQLDILKQATPEIEAYEAAMAETTPWVYHYRDQADEAA